MEYRGWLRHAQRGGHIPGAVHLDWQRTLQRAGTLLPPEALKALLLQAGVLPDKHIITYCQVGVRASHVAFVLTLLGYPQVAVYDGSWAEWGNDPHRPIE
jgi:thiosulfate/3-mercaptopyruvate sulfurtransferase